MVTVEFGVCVRELVSCLSRPSRNSQHLFNLLGFRADDICINSQRLLWYVRIVLGCN
jgi:hypothetical protein